MSNFLDRLREVKNRTAPAGGELSEDDFDSPISNDLLRSGKAQVQEILDGGGEPKRDFLSRLSARKDQPAQDGSNNEKIIATTPDGGRVIEHSDGRRSFASPSYSTTDPDRIAQIMEGATPAEASRSGFNQDIIGQHPVAARAIKAVEGTPFVGSYLDEGIGAVAGEDAARAVRATSQAMDEENPNESLALNLGGAVVGGGAIAAAALPAVSAAAPSGVALKAGYAGLTGATTGAAEGAIYGAGQAEDGGRTENAFEGAAFGGALGLGFGTGGSLASDGMKAMMRRFRGVDSSVIASEFGLSKKAAKAVKQALVSEDLSQARKILAEMGDEAMLADSGPATGAMLDAVAQTGGKALRATREAVDGRLARMSPKLTAALDATLGKPKGTRAASRGIAQSSSAARKKAYDQAFSKPINYASDKGRRIEDVLERVPERTMRSAIQEANEAMVAEGITNQQILADIGDDGSVVFREMPNTQQAHEIKVALQSIAQKETDAVTGKVSSAGLRASKLASSLRDAINDANPLYRRATKLGGDKIAEDNALDMGAKLFRPNTTVETVEDFMTDATGPTRAAMKQGVRNHIEQSLSQVKRAITDSNVDARQSMTLVKDLSSSANRSKLAAAIGEKPAQRLLKEVDQVGTALELRGMVSRNSATAARQAIQGEVKELAQPGAIRSLGRGEPIQAGQKIVQALTGVTDANISDRSKAMFDEIADALTKVRGPDAERALTLVESAMKGQPLKDVEAQFVARLIASPAAIGGDAYGRERLAR